MAEYVRVSSHVGSKKFRNDLLFNLVWGKSAKCCGCVVVYINRRDLFVSYFIKGNACISMGGVFNRRFSEFSDFSDFLDFFGPIFLALSTIQFN